MIRALLICLTALACLAAAPARAAFDLSTEEAAAQSLAAEVRYFVQLWQVNPIVRYPEGGVIEAPPGGDVRLSRNKLARLIEGLPDDQALPVLRFVLGHEFWHKVQQRDRFDQTGSYAVDTGPPAQVEECQADIMGAHAAASQVFAGLEIGGAPTQAVIAGEQLQALALSVGKLEGAASGDENYPSVDQRTSTIRLGLAWALLDKLESAADPRFAELIAGSGVMQQRRAGENRKDWSRRMCQAIVHAGDARLDLAIENERCAYNVLIPAPLANPSGQQQSRCEMRYGASLPTMEFAYTVRNVGPYRVRTAMRVSQYQAPSDLSPPPGSQRRPTDFLKAILVDFVDSELELAPGEAKTVSGVLRWDGSNIITSIPEGFRPTYVGPRHELALFTADRIRSQRGANLSGFQRQLDIALAQLADDTTPSFSGLRGAPCDPSSFRLVCPLKRPMPGFARARLARYNSSGLWRLEARLADSAATEDRAKAIQTFSNLLIDLRASRPEMVLTEEPNSGSEPSERFDRTVTGKVDGLRLKFMLYVLDTDTKDEFSTISLSFERAPMLEVEQDEE